MDQTRAIPRGKNSWKKKDEGWVGQDWKGIESVRASERVGRGAPARRRRSLFGRARFGNWRFLLWRRGMKGVRENEVPNEIHLESS